MLFMAVFGGRSAGDLCSSSLFRRNLALSLLTQRRGEKMYEISAAWRLGVSALGVLTLLRFGVCHLLTGSLTGCLTHSPPSPVV